MKNLTVARRYARALYQLATESKNLDDVMQGMGNVAGVIKSSPQAAKILLNPLIKPLEKEALLKSITSNKLIHKFAALLGKRKRFDLFSVIFDQMTQLVDSANGVHRILVRSAASLSDDQKRQIEKNLAASLGGSVLGQFEIAKDLLGGIWVKVGDKVLDLSLRGRFEDLKRHLVHSTN